MTKFSIGQKVKVIASTYSNVDKHIKNNMVGKICEINRCLPDGKVYNVYTPDKSDWYSFNESDLQPINEPRTLADTVPGDVIVDSMGNEYEVLEPAGFIVYKGKESGNVYVKTAKDLKNLEYTIQTQDEAIQQAIELLTKNGITASFVMGK